MLRMPDLGVEVWKGLVKNKSRGKSRLSSNYAYHTGIHVLLYVGEEGKGTTVISFFSGLPPCICRSSRCVGMLCLLCLNKKNTHVGVWLIIPCKAPTRVKLLTCLSVRPYRGVVGLEIDGKFLACFCQGGSGQGFVAQGGMPD